MAEWEYAPAPESAAIGRLRESYGMFVDGQFTGGEGGTLKTVNPATEEVLAEVAVAGEADVERAVAAARRAYETTWPRCSCRSVSALVAALRGRVGRP